MQTSLISRFLLVLSIGLFVGSATAEEKEPESASDAKPKVTKVGGLFEAVTANEVVADTEHLTDLEIKRILPHGTRVKKGQNVVWFETEDIDKKIKDAEIDLRLAKLKHEEDELKYKQFLENQTLDKAKAERARKNVQQDYDNFIQVDRERQLKSAAFNLKSAKASLENVQEELKQLEQMYKEDDLTEESEEIVLKRAKESVEFAEYRLEGMQINSDRIVGQTVPRSELTQKDALDRAQLAYQKSIHELAIARQREDIEIARKRDQFKEKQAELKEMQAERGKIVLQASNDGIVLHGKLNRGKLGDKPSTLEPGSKVTATQVIATVVNPTKLQIRVDLAEKDRNVVNAGAKCKVNVGAFGDFQMNGTVKSVSTVPYAGTKYDCVVTFRKSKNQPDILPTMTCELEFEHDEAESAEDSAKEK